MLLTEFYAATVINTHERRLASPDPLLNSLSRQLAACQEAFVVI